MHVTPAMFRNWRRLCRREGNLGEVWSCVKFFGLQIEFLSKTIIVGEYCLDDFSIEDILNFGYDAFVAMKDRENTHR